MERARGYAPPGLSDRNETEDFAQTLYTRPELASAQSIGPLVPR